MALTRGVGLHQYLDDWLIRAPSQEEAQANTVLGLPQSLVWIIKYYVDSALVKPTHERWLKLQDLILRLKST